MRHRIVLERFLRGFWLLCLVMTLGSRCGAQDRPYFITYWQDLEEPGEAEIELKSAISGPDAGNGFGAGALEMEYGVRAWWTAELYLDGQSTAQDSTLFTGFRTESRFRPIMRELPVNPLLYVEYENISSADKTILEVVGHDGQTDMASANWRARRQHQHEGELKLILSSNVGQWNLAGNFIAEKNLAHAPWEFGYAVAVSRPLRRLSDRPCTFCAEKFVLGAELYGGLGTTWALTMRDTSHYLAPLVGWQLPRGLRLNLSPGWGLTSASLDRVYRVGVAVDCDDMAGWFRNSPGRSE